MMKFSISNFQFLNLFLIIFLIALLFLPLISLAEGLVPCGRANDPNATPEEQKPCQFCHIFVLFQNILNFLFFTIVPPLAILMIAIAGMYFIFSGGNPGNIETAKSMLKGIAIALLIIYGSWLFINLFFMIIGVSDWTGLEPGLGQGWFKIDCQYN